MKNRTLQYHHALLIQVLMTSLGYLITEIV